MSDFLNELSTPLTADEIDFRIQSINKGGYATILVYKDARVDINRLNKVCGRLGWEREHSRDNKNCTVSIWDGVNKQWVSKEDTGTESYTEAEKGLASDSFKRACVNWGIGVELYDYPVISVKLFGDGSPLAKGDYKTEWFLNPKKKDKYGNAKPDYTWNLKLKEWKWRVDHVGSELTYIAAKDQNGEVRFSWGSAAKKAVTENMESVTAVKNALNAGEIGIAAEAWFEIDCNSRKNMYVSEKHGGVFTPTERKTMQDEFINYYQGDNYSGLFSELN